MPDVNGNKIVIGGGVVHNTGKIGEVGRGGEGVSNTFADNHTVPVGKAIPCHPGRAVVYVGIKCAGETAHTFKQARKDFKAVTVIIVFQRFQTFIGIPDFFFIQGICFYRYPRCTPVAFHCGGGNEN